MKKLSLKEKKNIKNKIIKGVNITCYVCTGILLLLGLLVGVNSCNNNKNSDGEVNKVCLTMPSYAYDSNNMQELTIGEYYVYDIEQEFHIRIEETRADSVYYSLGFARDNGKYYQPIQNSIEITSVIEEEYAVYYIDINDTGDAERFTTLFDLSFLVVKADCSYTSSVNLIRKEQDTSYKNLTTNYLWDLPNIHKSNLNTNSNSYFYTVYEGLFYKENGFTVSGPIFCGSISVQYVLRGDYYEPWHFHLETVGGWFSTVGTESFDGPSKTEENRNKPIFYDGLTLSIRCLSSKRVDGKGPEGGGSGGNDTTNFLGDVFALLSSGFNAFMPLFMLEIAPGLYLGVLILIPLVVSLIILIVKIASKGG